MIKARIERRFLLAIDVLGPRARNSDLIARLCCSESSIRNAMQVLADFRCIEVSGTTRDRRIVVTDEGRRCLRGETDLPVFAITQSKPRMTHKGASKTRACLMCRKPFESEGPGNQVCKRCKATSEWKSGPYGTYSVGGVP